MKGSIRIAGALILGVVIVLGALYASTQGTVGGQEGSIVSATNYERDYIESRDSDGDGIKDWEENLQARFIQTIDTATTSPESAEYTPPETFTGKFSEAFLQDYLQGKMDGQDFSDPTAFIETAVAAIEEGSKSKTYSPLDVVFTADSEEALRTYGNAITDVIQKDGVSNPDTAMIILQTALEKNDPSILVDLVPIRLGFENLIQNTLEVPVPKSIVNEHIALLNAYEALRTNVAASEQAFIDPLFALARVKEYPGSQLAFFNALKAISEALRRQNIIFTIDENGSFFYKLGL